MACRGELTVRNVHVDCPATPTTQAPVFQLKHRPPGAKYLAVTFIDVDPRARGFVHWLAWDMDEQRKKEGKNSYGFVGYGAPCPPTNTGSHTYVFTVYAYKHRLPPGPYTYESLVPALHAAGVEDVCSQTLQFSR